MTAKKGSKRTTASSRRRGSDVHPTYDPTNDPLSAKIYDFQFKLVGGIGTTVWAYGLARKIVWGGRDAGFDDAKLMTMLDVLDASWWIDNGKQWQAKQASFDDLYRVATANLSQGWADEDAWARHLPAQKSNRPSEAQLNWLTKLVRASGRTVDDVIKAPLTKAEASLAIDYTQLLNGVAEPVCVVVFGTAEVGLGEDVAGRLIARIGRVAVANPSEAVAIKLIDNSVRVIEIGAAS